MEKDDDIEVYQEQTGGAADEAEVEYIKLKVVEQDSNEICQEMIKLMSNLVTCRSGYLSKIIVLISLIRCLLTNITGQRTLR